jgi:hypothetical protein
MLKEYRTPTRAGVSESLDALGDIVGGILVRGPEGWYVLPPGNPGDVLTSQGPDLLPAWLPPAP